MKISKYNFMKNFNFWFDKNRNNLRDSIVNIVYESMSIVKNTSNSIKTFKNDGSIVTYADLEVEEYIFSRLNKLALNIPIISEERKVNIESFLDDIYWIIDPIDGTNSFNKGKDEYTINIALIKSGVPICGVIGHPPSETIWVGILDKLYLQKQ